MKVGIGFIPELLPYFAHYRKVVIYLLCTLRSGEQLRWTMSWTEGLYDTGKSFDSIMYEVTSEMEYKTFFKLFVGITIDDKNFMDSTIYNFD